MKLKTGITVKEKNNRITVHYPRQMMLNAYPFFSPIGTKIQSAYIPEVRMNINDWFKKHF